MQVRAKKWPQVERDSSEVVNKSKKEIKQTWGPLFNQLIDSLGLFTQERIRCNTSLTACYAM